MFELELLKSNKKYMILAILLIIVSVIINIFISNDVLSILSNGKIKTNKLVINELMSSNNGAVIDENGNLCDWIEIYNGYNYNVNLKNYGLSDEANGRIKWTFPDVEIASKDYLIIYLSKEYNGKLHATLSLSQKGEETLTLKKPNGKVVDIVKTVSLANNNSMARDNDGKWVVTDEITPGYENTENGRERYLFRLDEKEVEYPLIISEFLPSNEGNVIFEDNKLYSYIEVTNISDTTINLKDYYLSNSEKLIYKWRFPNYKLSSGESYLVYTDSIDKNNHASFSLKHKTGNVILSTYDRIIEDVSYEGLANGVAYVKENGKWRQGNNVSPGYLNTFEGKMQFQKELDFSKNDLIINEVMVSNNNYLPQNGNQYYDWIELYNNSDYVINLNEYSLTTDSIDKNMFILPNKTLAPKTFYILMASGNTAYSGVFDHTNFKLSSGTGLFLYKNNNLVDSTYIYCIPKGYSYGRGKAGYGHYYYPTPTPGVMNVYDGLSSLTYEPTYSIPGGLYNNVNTLEVKIEDYYDVYYTLDGSRPTDKSLHYDSPIIIDKTTVIRAVSYINGLRASDIVTNSYIINENHTLPVMSVSLEQESFNSIQSNIYSEELVTAHAELYEMNSSFSIDCDLKLFGGESREWAKKSYSLKFNYGHLKYKVFDSKNLYEFNSLVLRSGSQDQNNAMLRDEFSSTLAIKYGTIDAQANKPVVLYINGQYWGVYFIREKINSKFIENNYNVSGITNITNCNYFTEQGNNSDILALRNYVTSHNLTDDSNYNYVSSLLDIDNYIDFWVFEFIVNNTDFHNYRYYNNVNINGGKIRMILYDLDYSMYANYGSYYLNYIQYPNNSQSFVDTTIFIKLMQNASFKKRFVERVAFYLKNVWNVDNINKEFDNLYNAISMEMFRNCARWNLDYNNWSSNAYRVKNFALNRIEQVISATKSYFNLSLEEVNEYFY